MSGYNLWAACKRYTLAPPLNSGTNAAPASVLVGFRLPTIQCLTLGFMWDQLRYPQILLLCNCEGHATDTTILQLAFNY